jgi:tRNA/tmRNA/rRNA uracil-C5-methylase (TrmA/RlmC/RlmD family)
MKKDEESKIEIINKRIEDCIDSITSKYSNNPDLRLVGIVDPPRAGVHRNVAKKLRTFKVKSLFV